MSNKGRRTHELRNKWELEMYRSFCRRDAPDPDIIPLIKPMLRRIRDERAKGNYGHAAVLGRAIQDIDGGKNGHKKRTY